MNQPETTLAELQRHVETFEAERGFDRKGVIEQCLLLAEEVGELFKAVRRRERLAVDPESAIGGVDEELADVLLMLAAVANRLDVDLSTALRAKAAVNSGRTWR
ncbi:MazG nucleotide pyrophosphohydrolase domain-containing protein [Phytomonospora endophytica]|uniref:NTP pyrophosphatase (Non-canonical NTP hydrolase) n=1 Tax=Phytomonospora endophytica TaxID=714109 RepID=A0A841FJ06_9ACTN|nr:MazG nucleotide pyrophosphohydrolase domain-containing protein [Phytomonospora endophytica]MBB6037311.1 NTP pyrophosphatase (non-canonical NTP hydrolase) [Phytomonospora endophytica]GIG69945.1 hypothetical protein Pen01_62400 [Phytomonospora endophytica]